MADVSVFSTVFCYHTYMSQATMYKEKIIVVAGGALGIGQQLVR